MCLYRVPRVTRLRISHVPSVDVQTTLSLRLEPWILRSSVRLKSSVRHDRHEVQL